MNKRLLRRYPMVILITVLCVVLLPSFVLAQDLPKGELPIMITSSGQSPDAFVVKVLLDRAKIPSSYDGLLEADKIEGSKTLIIVMGGSTKGLGAAGIDEKFEIDRTKELIDKAESQNMLLIGIHVGGESRRGPLSMQFIDVVSPRMKALIVTEDGNQDGYFTKHSEEKEIPLVVLKNTPEVGEVLQKIFQVDAQ